MSLMPFHTAGSQSIGASDNFSKRPLEGELAAATLWPETEKVFGHGYEVQFGSISP
jgi:hypothetical protein